MSRVYTDNDGCGSSEETSTPPPSFLIITTITAPVWVGKRCAQNASSQDAAAAAAARVESSP